MASPRPHPTAPLTASPGRPGPWQGRRVCPPGPLAPPAGAVPVASGPRSSASLQGAGGQLPPARAQSTRNLPSPSRLIQFPKISANRVNSANSKRLLGDLAEVVRVSRPKPYFVNTYWRLVPQIRSLLETRCESVARQEAGTWIQAEWGRGAGVQKRLAQGLGQGEWVNEEAGKQRRAIKSYWKGWRICLRTYSPPHPHSHPKQPILR